MAKISSRQIAFAGIVGGLYAVLTLILAPWSYGVYQVRVAEALTVLAYFNPFTSVGLYAGCLIANIFGGNGIQDIIIGPILTLLAGFLTYYISKIKSRPISLILAPLPPVVINAFGVAAYLSEIIGMDYFYVVQFIGLGQFVSCYGLGLPLLLYLRRNNIVNKIAQ